MAAAKAELSERIRRDSWREGLSIRALARRHGVHQRLVREALTHAEPAPRKTPGNRTFEQTGAITSLPGRNRRCLLPRSALRSGHCASGAARSFTARLTARSGCCHSPRMGLGERVRYQTSFTDSARWDGFVFRPGDIVISAPAKCGTTWLQMICALEIFKSATFDRPLDQISP